MNNNSEAKAGSGKPWSRPWGFLNKLYDCCPRIASIFQQRENTNSGVILQEFFLIGEICKNGAALQIAV
jgi:hypothetical protein